MSADRRKRRKHMARAQRERLQRRLIVGGLAAVALIVVGVLAYGWYDVNVRQPAQPVITVDGLSLGRAEFRSRVRFQQRQLLSQYQSTQQFMSLFSDDEQTRSSLQSQLDQIQSQLTNPSILGQQAIEEMIGDLLIRQEAERRGISVSEEEVQARIREAFGYYPEGTPTPQPSSTPDPTAQAALPPTPTATEGPSPTPSSAPSPAPTATAYTEEMFERNFADFLEQLKGDGIREQDYRALVRSQLIRQKLLEAFRQEMPREQEQVRARHILVEEEETAQELLSELEEGADWVELAAEYSTDQSNAEEGGDLGWFGRGRMVESFEEAAFGAEEGETVGPVESQFGLHLIQVLGRRNQELEGQALEEAVQLEFSRWLSEARSEADIDVSGDWLQLIPTLEAPGATSP